MLTVDSFSLRVHIRCYLNLSMHFRCFALLIQVGCTHELESFAKDLMISDIQSKFCARIYKESVKLSEGGKCIESRRDLFLEQSMYMYCV